jgi:hypothetical protein
MARKTTPKAAEAAPAAELEQVQTGGMGIDEGIVLATFFLLVTAIAAVLYASKAYPALGQ